MAEARSNFPSSFNQHKQLATKIKSTIFTFPWVYRTRATKKITSNAFNFPYPAERYIPTPTLARCGLYSSMLSDKGQVEAMLAISLTSVFMNAPKSPVQLSRSLVRPL